jgi:hypothetical protein
MCKLLIHIPDKDTWQLPTTPITVHTNAVRFYLLYTKWDLQYPARHLHIYIYIYIYIYGNQIAEQLQKKYSEGHCCCIRCSQTTKKNRKKMNAVTDHVSVMTHKE